MALAAALLLMLAAGADEPCTGHDQCAPGRCCNGVCAAEGAVCCGDGVCSPGEACHEDDGACPSGTYCGHGCVSYPDGLPCEGDGWCASGNCAVDWETGAGTCAATDRCSHAGRIDYASLVDDDGKGHYCNATDWLAQRPDGAECDPSHPVMCASRRCVEDLTGGPPRCCASGCAVDGACASAGTRADGHYCDDGWAVQLVWS